MSSVRLNPGANPLALYGVFALAYALSSALRSINAVIAPQLTQSFSLSNGELGLLSAVYFLGFTAAQLPVGAYLDRLGPRLVEARLLVLCFVGALIFSQATSFLGLAAGRLLLGVGVAACLMAPMTGFRLWLDDRWRTRLTAWMLMAGSIGMVAASVPAQWAALQFGWRVLFVFAAGCVALAAGVIVWLVPRAKAKASTGAVGPWWRGYGEIYQSRFFVAMSPMFILIYGGLVAMQTLWIGPWFTQIAGLSARDAAWGVLAVHSAMGLAFFGWGCATPWFAARGVSGLRLLRYGLPLGLLAWFGVIASAPWLLGVWSVGAWVLAFVMLSVCAQSQFVVASRFDPAFAGRVNTASNVLIFLGAFALQWAVGWLADWFGMLGLRRTEQLPAAAACILLCMLGSYVWFIAKARGRSEFE